MIKRIVVSIIGLICGMLIGYVVLFYRHSVFPKKQIIGFLPYWLTEKAQKDYSKYITTLTYFGLRVDTDGSIVKLTDPQQEEPGWYALTSGKLNGFFTDAIQNDVALSLLVSSGDQESIDTLMSDPVTHAKTLARQVLPLMRMYHFTDLNLDIESAQQATDGAQNNFVLFTKTVKNELVKNHLGTLTVEISPTDLIKKDLINPAMVNPVVDYMVVMGYDYHYIGSYVTGPVAPLFGAGLFSEYDVATAIEKAKAVIPNQKLILGIPLYGYGWETINNMPHAGVIPLSGLTQSTRSVEKLLNSCASCSAQFDPDAKESYVIYKDSDTGTYHEVFYPDTKSTQAKIDFANGQELAGLALWALGYEDSKILEPLKVYKGSL